MKKNHLFLGLATLFASAQLFTACSNDESDNRFATQQSKDNTISLTSSLGMTRATSDPQTTQLSTSVKVGAFGITGTTAITNGDNNQYSVAANGDLSTTNDMVWPALGDVNIYAYAPYQDGWVYNEANSFTVAADQSTAAGYLASDLVHGTPASNPVSQTEEAIALSFTHKLSKINITIQKAENATIDLSEATVTIMNTKIATTLNPSTGAIGEATGDATDILAVSALGEATTACAILVPQQLAADTRLVKIEADSKILYAKLGAATTFVGGKSYNFTVKVGSTPEPITEVTLLLGSTSIVTWDSEDLGEAPAEEPVVEPMYATFGSPAANATYEAPTYTWISGSNNLMPVFEFANGELTNYNTLTLKLANLTGSVRIGYFVGSTWTQIQSFSVNGTKTIDLTTLNIDLSTVTRISFGGAQNSSSGSVDIVASDFVLTKESNQ